MFYSFLAIFLVITFYYKFIVILYLNNKIVVFK